MYADFDRMLETEKPDCVYVFTPHEYTAGYALRLIAAGIPAFVEKPAADTPESLRELLAAYRRRRTPHIIGFNRRFSPIIAQLSLPRGTQWEKSLTVCAEGGRVTEVDVDLARDVVPEQRTAWYFNGIEHERRYFLDCLRSGSEPHPNVEDTVGTMRTAFAMRAGHSGRLEEYETDRWSFE